MTKASPCLPALLALSASLRTARTAEGLGLRQLAHKLGISAQVLSLWETGKRAPAIEDVAHVLGFLRVSPVEYGRVMRLRQQLEDPISIETLDAGSTSQRRALEALAVRTFDWAPHVVPEPLQTPEYIRAIAQEHAAGPDDLDQAVFEHQVRQLDQDWTGHHTVLVGTAALAPAIDPQLQALRAAANLPGLVVKIVPPSVAKGIDPFTIYEGQSGAFTVALRHQDNVIFINEPDAVRSYRSTFKALERGSVTCADFRSP
ncbi:Scr1 family TA system antitoxin-like transcriptional regulator [Amycolatopsis sp. A133]|uniref:helix-turn-helix domain-containing protein n=1 Tax=Amycolatopsis sp. A133 TaxID=3064472 RepID=UPI0027F51829|nr:Scr1 family TA system antitoxin-like transcriptional regulator [Amycolatopsis sp. A133]MDQ7805570.1 Scr1 family TA system antitoxin-like transcriptional regulator [Amycolatopsis sp. A133]